MTNFLVDLLAPLSSPSAGVANDGIGSQAEFDLNQGAPPRSGEAQLIGCRVFLFLTEGENEGHEPSLLDIGPQISSPRPNGAHDAALARESGRGCAR